MPHILKSSLLVMTILLSVNSRCPGQQHPDEEEFINAVLQTIVPNSYTTFILCDTAHVWQLDKQDLKTLQWIVADTLHPESIEEYFSDSGDKYDLKTLQQLIGDSLHPGIIAEMFLRSGSDTIPMRWDCSRIKRSRCTVSDSVGWITGGRFAARINRHWTKRKRKRELYKQYRQHLNEFSEKPAQEIVVFRFSRPIFSQSGDYALISLSYSCGNLCAYGCTYLFKKTGNSWQKLAKMFCWVS